MKEVLIDTTTSAQVYPYILSDFPTFALPNYGYKMQVRLYGLNQNMISTKSVVTQIQDDINQFVPLNMLLLEIITKQTSENCMLEAAFIELKPKIRLRNNGMVHIDIACAKPHFCLSPKFVPYRYDPYTSVVQNVKNTTLYAKRNGRTITVNGYVDNISFTAGSTTLGTINDEIGKPLHG